INYTANVGKSTFYKQYFEEMLFNYMDALNTLYVATTRAKKHLFLLAPSYKKTDKAAPTEYISDILDRVLNHANSPYILEDNKLLIDATDNGVLLSDTGNTKTKNDFQHTQTTYLSRYPQSATLQQAFNKGIRGNINSILMLDQAAQHG